MRRANYILTTALASTALYAGWAQGGGDLTGQDPVEIKVELGNADDALRFFPDSLSLETSKLYRLVLHNPSPQKHYFSSAGLARAVFTRKVQVNGTDGKPIGEVKGMIQEIEVYPNGTAEWWFVPVKTGEISDLQCTIEGHAAGGMVGRIAIQ
jgi:uncharacterized cupredoxin-like copper-binding protein